MNEKNIVKTATNPKLDLTAETIFGAVVEAMQPAEELGGPTHAAYVELMLAIAAEAQVRVSVCVGYAMRALDEAQVDQVVLARVRGALDTEETGDALVDVARAATAAERRLAQIEAFNPRIS